MAERIAGDWLLLVDVERGNRRLRQFGNLSKIGQQHWARPDLDKDPRPKTHRELHAFHKAHRFADIAPPIFCVEAATGNNANIDRR